MLAAVARAMNIQHRIHDGMRELSAFNTHTHTYSVVRWLSRYTESVCAYWNDSIFADYCWPIVLCCAVCGEC